MKLKVFSTIILSLTKACYAWPHDLHAWHPALPTDSRSPCPGLNVLANHGWLPRSGKNIDISMFRSAIKGAYNYAPTALDFAFNQALDFNLTTTGNISTINLADLARHDEIEFDGSLSRNDIYFGDNLHFDPVVWGTVAKHLKLYETLGEEKNNYVTVEMAAKARAARVAEAKRVNPSFNASANEMSGSPGTTGLYLLTMWDDNFGAAPKAWVRAFFGMESF
ncbi:Chloroperoxidase [Penicillium angulare]|uniref:Chloroperoxidase n=1 Tax=Penicillium angulare TaxID=116970 RepID=A0A9W9ESY9_9EURO|nr:Chloroperoxidase [Penicillium angulare]